MCDGRRDPFLQAIRSNVSARGNAVADRGDDQPGWIRQPAWIRQLTLAADQFIVQRCSEHDGDADAGATVIAGYPWFSDWGRDTMIALPGLTLATGRARDRRGNPDDLRALRVRRGCCRTAFRIRARRRSTTPSTRRCGTSTRSRSTSTTPATLRCCARCIRCCVEIVDRHIGAPATASGSTLATACSPPANPACS